MIPQPVRILIVDDEPDVEMLVRQRFRRRPEFQFVFARNGQEALALLERDSDIDVLVTDINMPVMDGLTLLSKLDHHGRLMKAIILSAYGDMPNIRTAMNRGAFDFLTKPIDFQDFDATIRKTLEALAASRQGMEARAKLMALEQELEVASRIQQSTLPKSYPENPHFEVFAEMIPARQVGGDFYDFFPIGEDRLAFVIGDVSGKGVPAALFMAVSRTLLKAVALQGLPPDQCLAYVNQVLRKQGDDGMFVTVFYGILDVASGEIEYAIGGHNPPYVVSADREPRMLAEPAGVIMGVLPNVPYETGRTVLAPGDLVFLYTDGVTESENDAEEFFSEWRLRALLSSLAGTTARDLAGTVLHEVRAFSGGAPRTDDITLLALRWLG
jgi:sigma-B regulation protein RsbU (phosphoserine phosphatase)